MTIINTGSLRYSRKRAWWPWVVALVLVAVATGTGIVFMTARGGVPASLRIKGSEAEEIVKAYILEHANDPKSVSFDRWGPHKTPSWLTTAYFDDHSNRPMKIVRVVYRVSNDSGALIRKDQVFFIVERQVHVFGDNALGDDYMPKNH